MIINHFKKFSFLLLLTPFVLTACTNPFAKKKITEAVVPTHVVVQADKDNEKVGKTSDTVVENNQYVSRYGKNMKCSNLKNAEKQKMCEMQINDVVGAMLEAEIIESFDVGRCDELPADVAQNCKNRLTETGVQGPVSASERELFSEIMRGKYPEMNEGDSEILSYPTYDKSKCAELHSSGYRAYCEKKIAEREARNQLEEVIQAGDVNRCDEFSDDDLKRECKMFFGVFPEAVPEGDAV